MLYFKGDIMTQGTYWDVETGERVIPQDGTMATKAYIKMPAPLMLVCAPIMGLLFAVFLPFIGIAMSLNFLAKAVYTKVAELSAQSMSFGWRPIEAYLSGRKTKKKKTSEVKNRKE